MMPIRYVVDSSPDNSAKETNKIMVLVRTRLVLLINSPYSVKLSFVAKIIYFIISFLLSLSSQTWQKIGQSPINAVNDN